jgi:hypothetical protein
MKVGMIVLKTLDRLQCCHRFALSSHNTCQTSGDCIVPPVLLACFAQRHGWYQQGRPHDNMTSSPELVVIAPLLVERKRRAFDDEQDEVEITTKRAHRRQLQRACSDSSQQISRPLTMTAVFTWAFSLLHCFCKVLGAQYVRGTLKNIHWRMTAFFSGIDCAAFALDQLSAACMETFQFPLDVVLGPGCEVDKACQRVLLKRGPPSRCIFGDILAFTSNPDLLGTKSKIKVATHQYCLQHKQLCPRNIFDDRINVDVSGPPCVLFSNYGHREGFQNKTKSRVHHMWTQCKHEDRTPLIIHENVPGFPEARLVSNTGKFLLVCRS